MKTALEFPYALLYNSQVPYAGVMELVDVTDSKSVGSDTVWVRVPPPAPPRRGRHIVRGDFF